MTWILNSERSEMIDGRHIRRAYLTNVTHNGKSSTGLSIITDVGVSIILDKFESEEDAKYQMEKLTQALAEDFPGYVIRKRNDDLSYLISGGKTDE